MKITQEDINKTTEEEFVRGTTRCLPEMKDIPPEFLGWNIYTRIADSIYCGEPSPEGFITFNNGFEASEQAVLQMQKFINAHFKVIGPSYEHKVAGIGFLISQIMTIVEPTKESK